MLERKSKNGSVYSVDLVEGKTQKNERGNDTELECKD